MVLLILETTWGINEIITFGINNYGLGFLIIAPIFIYGKNLFNKPALDDIRKIMMDKISIPSRNSILLESKYTILSEVDNIIYEDSKNKTKMLKELCRLIIEKTYDLVNIKNLNSENIIKEYKNTKEDFKTYLKTEYGDETGTEVYEYVIPVISKELSVLIYNLTANVEMLRINKVDNRFFIDTFLYSYIQSIVRKFEFGFYQFNGQIDNIINKIK